MYRLSRAPVAGFYRTIELGTWAGFAVWVMEQGNIPVGVLRMEPTTSMLVM